MEIFYNCNTHNISWVTCDLKLIIIFLLTTMMTQYNSAISLDVLTTNVYKSTYYTKWTKQTIMYLANKQNNILAQRLYVLYNSFLPKTPQTTSLY